MPSPEPAHRVDVAREFPPYRSGTAAQAHAGARSASKRPSTSSCPPEEITFGIVAIAKGYGGWRLSVFNELLWFISPRIATECTLIERPFAGPVTALAHLMSGTHGRERQEG